MAPELVTGGLSLILKGKSGRGKTHLAVAYRIVERGRLMLLDGPSYRTQPQFPENTGQGFRNPPTTSLASW